MQPAQEIFTDNSVIPEIDTKEMGLLGRMASTRLGRSALALTLLITGAVIATNYEDMSGEGAIAIAQSDDLPPPPPGCWYDKQGQVDCPATTTTSKPPPPPTTTPKPRVTTTTSTTSTTLRELLIDSDNDGIPDAVEEWIGSNFENNNSDGDLKLDSVEVGKKFLITMPYFLDEIEGFDPVILFDLLPDSDGDGKYDISESNIEDVDSDRTVDELDNNDNTPPTTTTTENKATTTTTTEAIVAPTTTEAEQRDEVIVPPVVENIDNGQNGSFYEDNKGVINYTAGGLGAIGGTLWLLTRRRRKEDDENQRTNIRKPNPAV